MPLPIRTASDRFRAGRAGCAACDLPSVAALRARGGGGREALATVYVVPRATSHLRGSGSRAPPQSYRS